MNDILSVRERSERMRLVRSRDTKPEMQVRRMLHGLGYRFRIHYNKLPGKPDIVLPSRRKAIFVHGCFWHRHANCRHARLPKSRKDYWLPKLERNRVRDATTQRRLRRDGWSVMVVWECQLKNSERLAGRFKRFLGQPSVHSS